MLNTGKGMIQMAVVRRSEFIKGESGAALIAALFLITIMTTIGMLVLNTTSVEIEMAANQKSAAQVFYAARAGLERGLRIMVKDMEEDTSAGGPWGNLNFPASAGSVAASYVSGSTTFDPDVRSLEMYRDASSVAGVRKLSFANGGTTLGNSTYEIYMYSPNNNEVYMLAYASGPNGAAALEYHLDTEDNSPYNNAVFSGTGINGKVTGNVNISGSIYSLGKMYFQGNVSLTNNYTDGGIDSVLEAILPTNTDLDSKIRVKGADLNLKGSAQIGTSSVNGAVSDIQVDGNFSSSKPYYSDNVGSEVPNIPMPSMLDGLEAEFPGVSTDPAYSGISNEVDRAMTIYKDLIRGVNGFAAGNTYAAAVTVGNITSKGVVVDDNWIAGCEPAKLDCDDDDDDDAEPGEIQIDSCTPDFQCVDSLGNGITYNSSTNVVTFVGMVYVEEEFEIETDATFTSKGAFIDDGFGNPVAPANQDEQAALVISQEEIEVEANFVPDNGAYLKGGADTNSIGFIAGEEIELEGKPGDLIAGMFFTPGEFEMEHQIQIAGTLIAGQFEFEQVPDVFQVPSLASYLPKYMPGTQSVVTFKNREWKRIY